MAVINVIQTGTTLVSPAVPDRTVRKSRLAYTGLFQKRQNRIEVPVKVFFVEINGKKILIDTGWSAECASHPIQHMGFGLWFASEPVIKEQESVYNQLQKMGIKPSDINAVILTHLDCDHASGLADLKGIKHIYTTEEEWQKANKGDVRYNKKFWKDIHFEFLKMTDDSTAPFGKSCDLFDDGSVKIVFTPGHSAGSVAVIIKDNDKFAVIAGDNGYNRNSWERLALPGPIYDKENMKKALQWVREMNCKENCIGIFAAHDSEIKQGEYRL